MVMLLMISLVMVFIVDLSGVIGEIEEILAKMLGISPSRVHIPKPFSCSLCMTWWTGLIYLVVTGYLNWISIAYVALLAYLTPVFKDLLLWLRDILTLVIEWLYTPIDKR